MKKQRIEVADGQTILNSLGFDDDGGRCRRSARRRPTWCKRNRHCGLEVGRHVILAGLALDVLVYDTASRIHRNRRTTRSSTRTRVWLRGTTSRRLFQCPRFCLHRLGGITRTLGVVDRSIDGRHGAGHVTCTNVAIDTRHTPALDISTDLDAPRGRARAAAHVGSHVDPTTQSRRTLRHGPRPSLGLRSGDLREHLP
jgi:hypothetical protein